MKTGFDAGRLNATAGVVRRANLAFRAFAVVALSTALGATVGCSKPAPEKSSAETVIRVGVGALQPGTGNPYVGITLPATLALQAIFDTVTLPDGHGGAAPSLAVAWRADGPQAWILTLRPDVAFSNGEPLTADALVESVKHMTTPKGRGETIGSNLAQIESAERIDDLTVRVRLNEPDPLFPLHASIWRVPAPASWRELEATGNQREAIGSGPFVKVSRTDSQVALKANPKAWRKPGAGGLEITLLPDVSARLQAFLSGAIDVAVGLPSESKAQVEQAGGKFTNRMTSQVDYIGFNTQGRTSPLADVRVRRALNLAVNRQQIVDQILKGASMPASHLAMPGAFGFDPDLKPIPYDPAQAKALLAEAGHAAGMTLTMAVTIGETVDQNLYFQQIASDLKKVGVEVEIVSQPSQRLMQSLFVGKIDADMFNWVERGNDPLTDYHFRSCVTPSKARVAFFCDPAVTALARQAVAEQDLDKRAALYRQIIRIEQDSPPGILLWQRPEFTAVRKGVDGFAPVEDVMNLQTLRTGP